MPVKKRLSMQEIAMIFHSVSRPSRLKVSNRSKQGGRPEKKYARRNHSTSIHQRVKEKVTELTSLNPEWGSARILAGLKALGITTSRQTIQKYLVMLGRGSKKERLLRMQSDRGRVET